MPVHKVSHFYMSIFLRKEVTADRASLLGHTEIRLRINLLIIHHRVSLCVLL